MTKLFKIKRLNSKDFNRKKSKKIYYFLINNIQNTTFQTFGFNFFLESLKINLKNTFYIEHKNKIVSYISYIDVVNEFKIKKILIKNIIKNPFKNFLLILMNLKFFYKFHKRPKKFIQLMHLIIKFKGKKDHLKKSKLHNEIENLHKMIIKTKYEGIYASYENKNLIASKYYKRNNYQIFSKNFFYTFVKKKIKNT